VTRRVYLAGRFSRRDEFNGYADRLRSLGFTVDARWLTEAHEWYGERDEDALAAARRFALDDLADVLAADIVLVFTEPPAPGGRNRGGRHVEFGIALGQGKDIIVVGGPENVFHNLRGSIGLPDGTVHGTSVRIEHAATFDDVPDRLRSWLYIAAAVPS
jgi:nucleoside 2-deoxyribosyltransferase